MQDLTQKKCEPCEDGVAPLSRPEFENYLQQTDNWKIVSDKKIEKEFAFQNFKQALSFINNVGEVAEEEGHHPDMLLHSWNKVKITLYPHAIGGLSVNDFIIASRIDRLWFQFT